MQIGDVFFTFDINHRVYNKAVDRVVSSRPIYREHFRPGRIVGEEGYSWLITRTADGANPTKISKRKAATLFLSADQVYADCWRNHHKHKVCDLLYRCQDTDTLKAVALLLGYPH